MKLIIFGGKYSAKLVYNIVHKNYNTIYIYDSVLQEKFFEGNYIFLNREEELIKILNNTNDLYFFFASSSKVAIENWINKFQINIESIINVISKDNVTLKFKSIGKGNLILSNSILDYDVEIGNFNFINNQCCITHDSIIGDHNFFGPSSTLLGCSRIENNCFIGANSVIDVGIKIEDNSIIGANSFINKNVKIDSKVFGTPGKIIK